MSSLVLRDQLKSRILLKPLLPLKSRNCIIYNVKTLLWVSTKAGSIRIVPSRIREYNRTRSIFAKKN